MFYDTHSHFDDERFDEDRYELIESIHQNGVDLINAVGADMPSSASAIELAHKYDFMYAVVGVHPHDADSFTEADYNQLKTWASDDRVKAIGEIGLDYYYDESPRDIQRKCFARQMELANEVNLPVVIHDRDAHGDTMDILKNGRVDKCGGVLHCFSGSVEMAKQALDLGMYLSVAGPVTFKNAAKLPEVVKYVPLDRLFIETDCPYLTPVPYRGKRNHSGYVRLVAEKIAEIKGITLEEVAKQTKQNAIKFFGI